MKQTVRVLALATNVPGPLAAQMLAERGAAVLKVEPPQGDPLERAAPQWYAQIVSGMDVVRLDLKAAADRERLDALLAQSDVFVSTLRPRALERAGLGAAALRSRFPRLCHVEIVGEPAERAGRAGHDLTYQAAAGLLSPPALPQTLFADLFAAERAIAAAYELLYDRERTGQAGRREVSIAAGALRLGDPCRFGLTAPGGPLGGGSPLYAIYRSADGWLALAALEPHFQERLRGALGIGTLDREPLAAAFAQRTNAQWTEIAHVHDLPIAALA